MSTDRPSKGEPKFLSPEEVVRCFEWGLPTYLIVRTADYEVEWSDRRNMKVPLQYTSLYERSLLAYVRSTLSKTYPLRKHRVARFWKKVDGRYLYINYSFNYGYEAAYGMSIGYSEDSVVSREYWNKVKQLMGMKHGP